VVLSVESSGNDQEMIDVYQWARERDITTMDTVDDARMYDQLTR
jgi:hypothetical protein